MAKGPGQGKGGGRKPKLTPQRRKAIVMLVRKGHSIESAATVCGIAASTVHEWMRRGEGIDTARPASPMFAEFAAEITDARSHLEGQLLASIVTAALDGFPDFGKAPDWRASIKLLEKLFPLTYGGAPMRTEEEMLAAAARLKAEHGGNAPDEYVVQRAIEIAERAEDMTP